MASTTISSSVKTRSWTARTARRTSVWATASSSWGKCRTSARSWASSTPPCTSSLRAPSPWSRSSSAGRHWGSPPPSRPPAPTRRWKWASTRASAASAGQQQPRQVERSEQRWAEWHGARRHLHHPAAQPGGHRRCREAEAPIRALYRPLTEETNANAHALEHNIRHTST